jgi:pSer/pThr/pTyr-binding forkhead associated (FHA) protein
MSGIIVLVLRIILAASLYFFLGMAIYTIWRQLNEVSGRVLNQQIPILNISQPDGGDSDGVNFETSEVIIGRDEICDYCIADDTVSARHARLNYHHKQWWVEDLQSTNGSFLNDERIYTPTVIISEDELRCGKIHLRFSMKNR